MHLWTVAKEVSNLNNAGTFTTSSTALNYMVASNGRVTVSGGSTPMVLYLYGQNQGFLVGADPDVTFGFSNRKPRARSVMHCFPARILSGPKIPWQARSCMLYF